MTNSASRMVPVDAHAHLHARFDPAEALDQALLSFSSVDGRAPEPRLAGILMFPDPDRHSTLTRLHGSARRIAEEGWEISPTPESAVLRATEIDSKRSVLLVAGRQIATSDGLEILALATNQPFRDKRPFRQSLRLVLDSSALAILPWGFGKWWGRRGRLVQEVLRAADPDELFVGDNAGRPYAYSYPRLLRWARQEGFLDLPGSDPLPMPGEHRRVGSYGFLVPHHVVSNEHPIESMVRWLRGRPEAPKRYGDPVATWRFVFHQVRMQIRKRL